MFEIDEGGDDEERNEYPVGERNLPRKSSPDGKKEKGGDQFNAEIAKGDSGAAIGTTSAQKKPTNQGDVLIPWNRIFTVRTKRTARFVDRKIEWQPINADIEEGTNRSAENKGEAAEQEFV